MQRRCEGMLRWDLLRRGVQSMARSAEAFVFLQTQWTKALASLSVASYLLGIGDRHLSNILINTDTGKEETVINCSFRSYRDINDGLFASPLTRSCVALAFLACSVSLARFQAHGERKPVYQVLWLRLPIQDLSRIHRECTAHCAILLIFCV